MKCDNHATFDCFIFIFSLFFVLIAQFCLWRAKTWIQIESVWQEMKINFHFLKAREWRPVAADCCDKVAG